MTRSSFGAGGFQNLAGRVGSGQEVFEMSWIESGRIGSGQIGSGLEVLKYHGSGRVLKIDLTRDNP